MPTIIIEEEDKIYRYEVLESMIEYQRMLRLFDAKRSPVLVRMPDGKWLRKTRDCNFCGACCITEPPIEGYMKIFGVKEMEGKLVCRFLFKEKWAEAPEDVPLDSTAPKERTLGSPLKSRENAELYVCKNPWKPYGCCSGPVCTEENGRCSPPECTVLYSEALT